MVFFALVGAAYGISRYWSLASEDRSGDASVDELKEKIAELKKKGDSVQKSLSPAQRELMIAGHKLVAMKEFGWSRLLLDIERILPRDVSASRINVDRIFKDGDTVASELEFSVVSRNYTSVLRMIERMNQSGIFRASLRSQDLQQGERFEYSEYTLLVTYRPSAGFSANPLVNVAAAQDSSENE